MKLLQKVSTASLAAATYLTLAIPAFAQENIPVNPCGNLEGGFANLCNPDINFGTLVARTVQVILTVAVIIALFFLIWGAIKWVTSGGDKTKVENARSTIIAAIVGLIIAFLAYFILQIILNLFGLGNITTLEIPNILGD